MSDHCCNHGHGHHHHHHDHDECCEHECHSHHHEKYSDELLALADEAWMEILKDKIKEQILKRSGKNLDEMAKLVSDANHERWKHKIKEFGGKDEFEKKLHDLLHDK